MAHLQQAARVSATAIVAAVAAWPGPAAAVVVQREFQATCLTQYGNAAVTIQAEADAPDSVVAGRTVAGVVVNATGTAPSIASFGLGLIGATSVEGTVDVVGTVTAPGVDQTLSTRMVIPNTPVPGSGPVTAEASGTLPQFTFPRAGGATVLLDSATFHITPITSSGTTPVGAVDGSCTLDPGQSHVLYTFTVTPPAPASTSAASGTSASARPTSAPQVGAATSAAPLSSSTPATATVAPVGSGFSSPTDAPTSGDSSLGPHLDVSGRASAGGGSDVVLVTALGLVAACGSLFGGFFWFNRRRRDTGARGDGE